MQEIMKNKTIPPIYPIFDKKNWKSFEKNSQLQNEKMDECSTTTSLSVNNTKTRSQTEKRRRRNYSIGHNAQKMKEAIAFYHTNPGKSYYEVSNTFGVERRALRERIEGNRETEAKVGKKSLLSNEEENCLVNHLMEMAELGFGYEAVQIRTLVRTLLHKKESEVTTSWFNSFMERHPNLSRRRAQALEKQRLINSDEETIQAYFDLLQLAFKKCKEFSNGAALTPNRVFVADEVGFSNDKTNLYVITKKGAKHPFMVDAGSMTHISIMAFAAANGWAGPAFFIAPGVRQKTSFNHQVKTNFPDATVILTKKGYMTEDSFVVWAEFFIEEIKSIRGDTSQWAILIIDGHHSHAYSLRALQILNGNNVLVVGLPSHTTHILQVHDVAVFRSLKEGFRKFCSEWIKKHGLNFKLNDFPQILHQAWSNANSSSIIRNGFKATGLWPLNLNWIQENKDKIKLLKVSPIDEFNKICARHSSSASEGFSGLVKNCEYLNIDLPKKFDGQKLEKSPFIQEIESRLANVEKNLARERSDKKTTKNQLGEPHGAAKVLNDSERLEKLEIFKKQCSEKMEKSKKDIAPPKKKVKVIKRAVTSQVLREENKEDTESTNKLLENESDSISHDQPEIGSLRSLKPKKKNKEPPSSAEEMKESIDSQAKQFKRQKSE